MEGAHELECAGRRFLRSLEDDRAAGGEGARHFSGRRAHREIPWRECRDRTDRLAQHGVAHAGLARDHPAVDPQAFGRVPFDDVAAAQDFELRLFDRLALFERHRGGHHVDALTNEGGGLQDDLRALRGRGAAPDFEALFGGGERIVEIGPGRGRHGAEHALVGGIDDRLPARALPLSVDVELDERIFGHGFHPVCAVLLAASR